MKFKLYYSPLKFNLWKCISNLVCCEVDQSVGSTSLLWSGPTATVVGGKIQMVGVCVYVCEHTWLHSHACFLCLLTKHVLFIALEALALKEKQPVWGCDLSPFLFPTVSWHSALTMQMGSMGTFVLFQYFIQKVVFLFFKFLFFLSFFNFNQWLFSSCTCNFLLCYSSVE